MYIASFFELQPKTGKYDSWLLKHECFGDGRIKPIQDKLKARVKAGEIRDCHVWETKTFYKIEAD